MSHDMVLDWRDHLKDGRQYLKTAYNGRARPTVFTPALIYNLTAMAIEQLLVALWQYHHQMPGDHTLDGLVDGLAGICPLEKDLAEGVKALARFDDMCPLVPVNRRLPTDLEIQAMLAVAIQVADFAGRQVGLTLDQLV